MPCVDFHPLASFATAAAARKQLAPADQPDERLVISCTRCSFGTSSHQRTFR